MVLLMTVNDLSSWYDTAEARAGTSLQTKEGHSTQIEGCL